MPTTEIAPKKGIDFIINSKRIYPDWLKQHKVFKELSVIDKVFPRIGLTNFKAPCEIMNTEEAAKYAGTLATRINTEIGVVLTKLNAEMDKLNFGPKVADREKKCSELQDLISLYSSVQRTLTNAPTKDGHPEFIIVKDGKTSLNLRCDIFSAKETTKPVFKKGEGLLKVLNKLKDLFPAHFVNFEQLQEFKDFSRTNVGKSTYNVVFSSTGDEGAWDIATASMRGIESCQSWKAGQSRGLIGTISSKYTAVMYMESGDTKIEGYGTKMLYRSMVRFCINQKTKKPAIVIDKMYPSVNEATLAAFKRELSKRSGGINVVYAPQNSSGVGEWYIPTEANLTPFLAAGEVSYQDTKINVSEHKVKAIGQTKVQNMDALTDRFKEKVGADLNRLFSAKREEYSKAFADLEKKREAFSTAKLNWEKDPSPEKKPFDLEEPKMDGGLHQFFHGGVENLFAHCDKKHGNGNAGKLFSALIIDRVPREGLEKCGSKEEHHKLFLMNFLREHSKIRELARLEMMKGSWAKSFPKSSAKVFDFVFGTMKGYLMASMKELLRGAMN